jgi:uncharacterized protein
MNPAQPLSDDEIDDLEDFLLSDMTPMDAMDISMLDGFFAALVLNPKLIMPGEYLPWVWDMEQGRDAPGFESLDQANYILGLLMRYYNSVLSSIGNNEFAPLFFALAQQDGSEFFDAEGWSEGFMLGVTLFPEPWARVFEKHPEYISPMVLLGTEHGWEMLEKCPDQKEVTQDAYESIAGAVSLLYEHFREQREAETRRRLSESPGLRVEAFDMPAAPSEIQHDEKCPCGSGKKFKCCCGAPQTLH